MKKFLTTNKSLPVVAEFSVCDFCDAVRRACRLWIFLVFYISSKDRLTQIMVPEIVYFIFYATGDNEVHYLLDVHRESLALGKLTDKLDGAHMAPPQQKARANPGFDSYPRVVVSHIGNKLPEVNRLPFAARRIARRFYGAATLTLLRGTKFGAKVRVLNEVIAAAKELQVD
jgi:hypothetical protein